MMLVALCSLWSVALSLERRPPPPPPPHEEHNTIYIIRHGEKIAGDVASGQLAHEAQCLSELGWARAYNLKSIFGPRPRPPFRTPAAIFSADFGEPLDCRDAHGWFRTQQTVSALAANAPGGLGIAIHNETGFMPGLCGLAWNASAKPGFTAHKADGQPEPYNNTITAWIDAQPTGGSCCPYGYGGCDGTCCNAAAARAMLTTLARADVHTVLVAWEHHNIPYLAVSLGAPTKGVVECEDDAGASVDCWPSGDYDSIWALTYDGQGEFVSIDTDLFQGFDYPYAGENERSYLGPKSYCGAVDPTEYPVTYPVYSPPRPIR